MNHGIGRFSALLHANIAQQNHGYGLVAVTARPVPGLVGRREAGTGAEYRDPKSYHVQILSQSPD
jgi:hypothetical protein